MKISSYITIKRINSVTYSPIFRGTNTSVFLDVDRSLREIEYIPTFYKTRKEAIESIIKWLPKYINN